MIEMSNKECPEPLTPCLQSRCNDNETGSTNPGQVHEGAQGSMEQRRSKDAAENQATLSECLKFWRQWARQRLASEEPISMAEARTALVIAATDDAALAKARGEGVGRG